MRISISAAGVLLSFIAAIACGESLPEARAQSMDRNWKFIDRYCDECHNITDSNGNLAFDTLHLDAVGADAEDLGKGDPEAAWPPDAAAREATAEGV